MTDMTKINTTNALAYIVCGACGKRRSAAIPDCNCGESPSRRDSNE